MQWDGVGEPRRHARQPHLPQVAALRAVISTDGMTADSFAFDHAFIGRIAARIVKEVKGINRVVYDLTSKPPGTIEWE